MLFYVNKSHTVYARSLYSAVAKPTRLNRSVIANFFIDRLNLFWCEALIGPLFYFINAAFIHLKEAMS